MSPPSGVALILGALGDFVLALPLLCALRRRGPLALWSRGPYRALLPAALADVPFVDTDGGAGASLFALGQPLAACLVETAQGAEVHAFLSPDAGLGGRLHEAGACAVIWHPPRPTAPPHVVLRGFAEAGLLPPAAVLDTPVMPRAPTGFVVTPSAPAGRRAARPWRAGNTPDWRASVPRRQSAREPSCFIGGVSGPLDTPVMPRTATAARALWLHPGSGSPAKSIPPAELAEFALQERHSPGMPLIVSFGEADTGLRTPVRKAFAQKGLSFEEVVCPSLRELRRRLEQDAGAFVGPDTGVTHLAAALGIPVTAVFRVTDPAIWRPVGRVRVVRND